MTTNAAAVRVGVTGKISRGELNAPAPTGTGTDIATQFPGMGYVHEDGVEVTIPGEGDSTPIKAWQNGETVRTVRTPSDDLPTWHFTLLETNIASIEEYFGVTVTATGTEGSFEYKVQQRTHKSYVLDVVDGEELIRHYIPNGVVTDLGSQTYSGSDAIGYEITISGDLDAAKGYNFKGWSTALRTSGPTPPDEGDGEDS